MARIPQMYEVRRHEAPAPAYNAFGGSPRGTNPFGTPNGSDVSLATAAAPTPGMRGRSDSDLSSIGGLMLGGGEYEELEHGRRGYGGDHHDHEEHVQSARGPAHAPDLRGRLHARIRSLEAELDNGERTSGYSEGSDMSLPIAPARVGAPRGGGSHNQNTNITGYHGPGSGAGAPSPAARTAPPRYGNGHAYSHSQDAYDAPGPRFDTPPLRVGSPRSSRPQSPATPRTRPTDYSTQRNHAPQQGYFPPTPQSPERRPPQHYGGAKTHGHAQSYGHSRDYGHNPHNGRNGNGPNGPNGHNGNHGNHGHNRHHSGHSRGHSRGHSTANSYSHSRGHSSGHSKDYSRGESPAHNYHYQRAAPPSNNPTHGANVNHGRPPPPRPGHPVSILQPSPKLATPGPMHAPQPSVALQLPYSPSPVSAHLAAPPRAYVSPFTGAMTPPASPSPPENKSIAGHDYLREKHATFREGEDEVFTPFSPRARQAGPRARAPGQPSRLGRKSAALSTVDFWKRFSTVAKLHSSKESAWMAAERKRNIWRNPYFVVPLILTVAAVAALVVWLVIKLTGVRSV